MDNLVSHHLSLDDQIFTVSCVHSYLDSLHLEFMHLSHFPTREEMGLYILPVLSCAGAKVGGREESEEDDEGGRRQKAD